MKKLLLILMLIVSSYCYSQKIIENQTDKFTKQHTVRTTDEKLTGGLSNSLHISLRSEDTSCFLMVSGRGRGSDVIEDGEQIIFLLDNDVTVTGYSTGNQDYQIGVGGTPDSYNHQYSISTIDLKTLSEAKLKSIRKYGSGHYNDFDIKDKNSDKLANMCKVFMKAVEIN